MGRLAVLATANPYALVNNSPVQASAPTGLAWAVHIPLALAAKGILDLHLPPGLHFLGAAGPISAALIVTTASRGASGLRELAGRVFRWRS